MLRRTEQTKLKEYKLVINIFIKKLKIVNSTQTKDENS